MPSTATILIVDDNETNRVVLRAQLESFGYAVHEAFDGVEAIAVLQREAVNVVISDLLMPRMDGYRLCQEIRRQDHLHGYAPSEPDSAACLLSSHAPTKPVARLSDLHGLMQAAVSETALGRETVD